MAETASILPKDLDPCHAIIQEFLEWNKQLKLAKASSPGVAYNRG